jgi:hypothetical protein
MLSSEDFPINYKPDRVYTLEALAAFNDWLKTHEFSVTDKPLG